MKHSGGIKGSFEEEGPQPLSHAQQIARLLILNYILKFTSREVACINIQNDIGETLYKIWLCCYWEYSRATLGGC